ncbi:putative secreted protein (Por secretion system target) [Flavobacterium sp. 270]|uniref:T9SS type A sorting domain-containing protein n=1 Tax=Flavobacterium sp. 270 TaxID=2512114 RepID=UPI0010663901|nr:T9SS type A sorting domain-containing protein [Flavobacterium sp. 270]TDW52488.1 putative secreted protein (Por secretion system target) [Flavobacterium sp. 270]
MKTKLLLLLLIFVIAKTDAQQQIYSFNSLTPLRFIEYKDNIFFLSGNDDTGRELWKSDGTTGGTSLVKDIYPGKENGGQDLLKKRSAILNDKLFFIGKDETSDGEIWKTDGTASGTIKVTNFLKGRVWTITAVGNSIYFLLKTENILQVWKTDGSSEGTVLVKDNLPIWNEVTFEGKCNNTFIFTFQPYLSNNSRVWRSDGTADGTFAITGEIDGNGSGPGGTSALSQYIENGDKLYFVSRYSLFETDGTLNNTKAISSLWNAQATLVNYSTVIKVDNNLYFLFFAADNYRIEIWRYNLENKNTSVVYSGFGSKYFFPSNAVKSDNSLLFCGPNNTGGTSLLSMDLNNYSIAALQELSPAAPRPFIFFEDFNVATIYPINNNDYFITSAVDEKYERKGWIFNKDKHTAENISALNNVWDAIVYKNNLYYGKDNVFWKYANNLSTVSIDKQPLLSVYPNPSSDFVNINTNNDYTIESAQVFDLNGKLVSNISDYKNNKVDISRLPNGIYNMQIKVNGSYSVNKKIIKK